MFQFRRKLTLYDFFFLIFQKKKNRANREEMLAKSQQQQQQPPTNSSISTAPTLVLVQNEEVPMPTGPYYPASNN